MTLAKRLTHIAALLAAIGFCHIAAAQAPAATPAPDAPPPQASAAPATANAAETGLAAVYSDRLNNRKTASGKIYKRDLLTAAHKTLPFGTRVKVTNAKSKKSVVVTINDRGPVQAGRVLDLSPKAAKAIGIGPRGMAQVSLEVVGKARDMRAKK